MSVAFFDLDSTLLDCNSGRLWLQFEWREGRVGWRQGAWAVWVLAQYRLGYAELEEAYARAVASLEGVEEALVAERTRRWFEAEVRERLRPGAREALRRHREAGDRLVLATSSSLYAAREAMAAYQLDDIVCSRFEVDAGRFTGKIAASAYGRAKADRVAEWAEHHGVDLATSAFYTDSIADVSLLERVGRPVAVHPDRRLAKIAQARNWPIVRWDATP